MGALLVYDVTKRLTFNDTQRWLNELKQYVEPDCVVMLIGNKIDLCDRNDKKREVSYEEAKCFAKENNLMFFETSAYSNAGVTDCFEDLLQEIYNERRKVTNKQKMAYNKMIKLASRDKSILISESKCCGN